MRKYMYTHRHAGDHIERNDCGLYTIHRCVSCAGIIIDTAGGVVELRELRAYTLHVECERTGGGLIDSLSMRNN